MCSDTCSCWTETLQIYSGVGEEGGGRKGKIVELFGLVRHSSKEEKEYVTNPTGVCIGG